jgi:hypothetical protein
MALALFAVPSAASAATVRTAAGHIPSMNCPDLPGVNKNVTATVANGKFVGNVHSGVMLIGRGRYLFIDVNGTLYSTRGTTQLFLFYEYCNSPHELALDSVAGGRNVRVIHNAAVEQNVALGTFYNVNVFVCNNYNGYRCGTPV